MKNNTINILKFITLPGYIIKKLKFKHKKPFYRNLDKILSFIMSYILFFTVYLRFLTFQYQTIL